VVEKKAAYFDGRRADREAQRRLYQRRLTQRQ
jgi:hypothetical protein